MAVNQMLPCWSATRPCGPEWGVSSGYSLKAPVCGSRRPSLLAPCPVYQSEPSGARAGSCGRDFGVGTSYSLIDTLSVPAAEKARTVRASGTREDLRSDMVPSSEKIVVPGG